MANLHKGAASVFISGALALSLVAAAAEGATPAAGTASSSLNAVTLSVTGIDGVPSISMLDLSTLATTDANAVGNAVGGNWAAANVVPLTVGGEAQGAHSASSDQASESATPAVDLASLGLPVNASVGSIGVFTSTTEDTARAAIGAAVADISALTDVLGLQIETLGIESLVNGQGASQQQGLKVSGLDVKLGDLLPAELLSALPIDVLLDLLAQLPVGAPNVTAVVGAINNLVADLESAVAGVAGTTANIDSSVNALASALVKLTNAQTIVDGLAVDQAAAQSALENAVSNAAALAASASTLAAGRVEAVAACALSLDVNCVLNIDNAIASAQGASNDAAAVVTSATATVDKLASDLAAASALIAPLADVVAQLTATINDLVAQLVNLVNNLLGNLKDLLASLTDLSGSLSDLIDGLLDVTLLGLGELDLSMSAIATDSVETSSAAFTCALSDLTVAGIKLGGGSCTGETLSGSLTNAVSAVESVLGALPLVGNLIPSVEVNLMETSSSVTEKDGVITATATVVPLTISVPSVTIDPANLVDGLIESLSGELIGNLVAKLPLPSELQGVGLNAAASQLDGLLGTAASGLSEVQVLIGDVVALLPDGLGIPALTTPGLNLSIDPTSTASFAPGTAAPSPTPAPAPAPAPAPLPVTGGGAIAMAALGLGGAWSLRRRR